MPLWLGPFEFQFTLDADEDVLSTASAPRYSASLHDTDADGETDSDYVPDRIVIDSDDEVGVYDLLSAKACGL